MKKKLEKIKRKAEEEKKLKNFNVDVFSTVLLARTLYLSHTMPFLGRQSSQLADVTLAMKPVRKRQSRTITDRRPERSNGKVWNTTFSTLPW